MNVALWLVLFYFSGTTPRQTLPLDGPEIVIELGETPKDQDPIIVPEPSCFGHKGQQECY